MKQQPQPLSIQFTLPLLKLESAQLPPERQRELVQALAELLLKAASKSVPPAKGGDNESEAHR
jgi:hypothetical protein